MTHKSAVYKRSAPEGVDMAHKERPVSLRPNQLLARVVCGESPSAEIFSSAAQLTGRPEKHPNVMALQQLSSAHQPAFREAGVNPVDAKFVVCDKLPGWIQPIARRFIEGYTPGFDFSGRVIEAPSGSGFSAGDAVMGTAPPFVGSLQEVVAVPLDQVAAKPKSLSFQEAASLPLVGLTAMQALREQNGLKAGQRLVVVGASGGVGHVAVQVGKALGAHVTAICSSANAEFVASRCGADAVVDYKSDVPVEEALRSLASTARAPFDLLLDCAAAAYEPTIRRATFDAGDSAAVPLLAGKYVCIGGVTSDWLAAGLKRKTGVDLFSRGRELFWIWFPCSAGALGELAELADAGKLRPSVAEVLPFSAEGVQSAFAKLNGRRTAGKIVIQHTSASIENAGLSFCTRRGSIALSAMPATTGPIISCDDVTECNRRVQETKGGPPHLPSSYQHASLVNHDGFTQQQPNQLRSEQDARQHGQRAQHNGEPRHLRLRHPDCVIGQNGAGDTGSLRDDSAKTAHFPSISKTRCLES
eukprot:CAMPEP_0177766326 /NCGR_PEP_ID=MMETSP0491_2-20121128/8467_1 /TAXON_ID=63592 /ORGANISM="Tetraselmis chuii, Strain PLY429" /LENGTH=528 /DNA_ID=CAMNT_0019282737 /DNA_START=390 /DNA_END=1977 /DNA_ORIENTATION=+